MYNPFKTFIEKIINNFTETLYYLNKSPRSPALQADALPSEPPGKPLSKSQNS